mgnify:CR=1 FL=1
MLPKSTIEKAIFCCPSAQKIPYWMDREDLIQEAYLAILESQKSYNPEKSKQETWAINYIHYKIKKLATKFRYQEETATSNEDSELEVGPSIGNQLFLDIFESMSNDAKILVKTILQSPHDFLKDTPKESRGLISKKLRGTGWSWGRIRKTISEIKSVLAS